MDAHYNWRSLDLCPHVMTPTQPQIIWTQWRIIQWFQTPEVFDPGHRHISWHYWQGWISHPSSHAHGVITWRRGGSTWLLIIMDFFTNGAIPCTNLNRWFISLSSAMMGNYVAKAFYKNRLLITGVIKKTEDPTCMVPNTQGCKSLPKWCVWQDSLKKLTSILRCRFVHHALLRTVDPRAWHTGVCGAM
jgi:hypothetical protein